MGGADGLKDPLWILRMMTEQFHRDDEGRPLREGRTPPPFLRAGEIEYKQCPFSGTRYRHEKPMNQSAIVQVSAHWDELAGALALFRELCTEQRGAWGPNLIDLWRVAQLGSALPWFFILNGQTSPAYAASLSKVMLGVGMWVQRKYVGMFSERAVPSSQFSNDEIIRFAEETDLLISPTEVCSASEKMMQRFFDVLTGAPPASPPGSPLQSQRAGVLLFGAHYTAFKHLLYLYYLARRMLIADIAAVHGTSPLIARLLEPEVEPPDYFLAEPGDLENVPAAFRAHWFRALADFLVPFAPDLSDAPIRALALEIGVAMGVEHPDPIARAQTAFATLDRIHGDTIIIVENALRRAHSVLPYTGIIDAATRDQLVITSARALFASL